MVEWAYTLLTILFGTAGFIVGLGIFLHFNYRFRYLDQIVRIFVEKPLFIVPRGQAVPDAEEVTFQTTDGISLRGNYLRGQGIRKGVILFGLEFGSNRWSCMLYCDQLLEAGYDIFTFDPRNQGDSSKDPTYDPLQWVTDRDLLDMQAAVDYLRHRPDADPRGIGFFGISKGGSVGLLLTSQDSYVRCIVTDGSYATYTTVVPYMRRWISIYSPYKRVQVIAPDILYGSVGWVAINRVARQRNVTFPWIESACRRVQQPVLMIHGEADTYIKADMAKQLFRRLATPAEQKALWIVPKAKHNQAPLIEPEQYQERLLDFFQEYLGDIPNVVPPGLSVTDPTPLPVGQKKSTTVAALEMA